MVRRLIAFILFTSLALGFKDCFAEFYSGSSSEEERPSSNPFGGVRKDDTSKIRSDDSEDDKIRAPTEPTGGQVDVGTPHRGNYIYEPTHPTVPKGPGAGKPSGWGIGTPYRGNYIRESPITEDLKGKIPAGGYKGGFSPTEGTPHRGNYFYEPPADQDSKTDPQGVDGATGGRVNEGTPFRGNFMH